MKLREIKAMVRSPWNYISREAGEYTEPEFLSIAGIDSVVVDPHNEAMPMWYNPDSNKRRILFHIDDHEDSLEGAKYVKGLFNGNFGKNEWLYAKELHTGGQIVPALEYGLISNVVFFNPRNDFVHILGNSFPLTRIREGRIFWNNINRGVLDTFKISLNQIVKYMDNQCDHSNSEMILDTDLDAFNCVEDNNFNRIFRGRVNKGMGKEKREMKKKERLEKTVNLLSKLPVPVAITIARSQTPIAFVPVETVDEVQKEIIEDYEKLYNSLKND